MTPINKPFLPPQEEYSHYIRQIWKSNWLTNNGALLQELECRLKARLGTDNLVYVTNGTIALQMAVKSLGDLGEIITTPFSFVATSSAIVWQNFTPVYCDIDQDTLNIDANKIEALISDNTKAILATHVYGNPCDVYEIEKIAKKHNIKVIYDGAHAFDVSIGDRSIFSFGDISICSLHATKYYHSTEGGLVICNSSQKHTEMKSIRNFGFDGPENFSEVGINGKNSEFHAAMGLVNLDYIDQIKNKRELLSNQYDEIITELPITRPVWSTIANQNYAYYPVILESENTLLLLRQKLEEHQIFTRRYFYPALNETRPYFDDTYPTPICADISKRVMCLPLYYDLTQNEVTRIGKIINQVFHLVNSQSY